MFELIWHMSKLLWYWFLMVKWILGGVCLISGSAVGYYRSLHHIYGVVDTRFVGSSQRLGRLPESLLFGGVFSVLGGLYGMLLIQFGVVPSSTLMYGLSVGGVSGLISPWLATNVWLARLPHTKRGERLLDVGTSGLCASLGGGFAGGIMNGIDGILMCGLVAGVLGGISTVLFMQHHRHGDATIEDRVSGRIIGRGLGGFLGGLISGVGQSAPLNGFHAILGGSISLILPGIVRGGMVMCRACALLCAKIMMSFTTPLLTLLRFHEAICPQCLQSCRPLRSQYVQGQRYCEHCHQELDETRHPEHIIVTFGHTQAFQQLPSGTDERTVVVTNPEMEHQNHPIEVTQIALHPRTCDRRLFERFVTYLLNHPPQGGVRAVHLVHYGTIDILGDHLKHVIHNTFAHIEQRPEREAPHVSHTAMF